MTLSASCPSVYDISAALWEGKLHPSFFALQINGRDGDLGGSLGGGGSLPL